MGKLINIDNGGTLTDFCVQDGATTRYTKTLTTPHDLSQCFFDGLTRVAELCYGEADVERLLGDTDAIRYSTTQGTNALVERKGPRLGVILDRDDDLDAALAEPGARSLFEDLIGTRVARVDTQAAAAALDAQITAAINALTGAGASRLVVAIGGAQVAARERTIERIVLRRYPGQLLGAVPVAFAHAMTGDDDFGRRLFTALFNSFLHPAMERFLYSAEHRLKRHHARRPLLVFRNDGGSARVAKTIALKTYSSGPRGGMEGARALARCYGLEDLLTCDVGGTTTDVGRVLRGAVPEAARGLVEDVAVSFPLCSLHSEGVGGSSIIRVVDGRLRVGPESVGAVPGPACFARGGAAATMTDVALLTGLVDPATYFDGELALDAARAAQAVGSEVAAPLGLDIDAALAAMEDAWVERIVEGIRRIATPAEDTTLCTFGGAGALLATRVAEALGVGDVLIPGQSAVFSAWGIGHSDLSQHYQAHLAQRDAAGLRDLHAVLLTRAERDMYAEGVALADCAVHATLELAGADGLRVVPCADVTEAILISAREATLRLAVVKALPHAPLAAPGHETLRPATPAGTRRVRIDGQWRELPLYAVEQLAPGDTAVGPAVVEERFFTGRIDAGWRFVMTANRDLRLRRDRNPAR